MARGSDTNILKRGTLVLTGSASVGYGRDYARGEVAVADGEGGLIFGADTDWTVDQEWGKDAITGKVQVGGIASHGTELGRWRAEAMLVAADLTDDILSRVDAGDDVVDAFLKAAGKYRVGVTVMFQTDDGKDSKWANVEKNEAMWTGETEDEWAELLGVER